MIVRDRWDCLRAEVRLEDVPLETRRAAERALRDAAQYHELRGLRVRWLPAVVTNVLGRHFGSHDDELWVRAGQGPAETANTVVHETTHARQVATARRTGYVAPLADREAEAYRAGRMAEARFRMGPTTPLFGSLLDPSPSRAVAPRSAPPSRPAARSRPASALAPGRATRAPEPGPRATRSVGGRVEVRCAMCDDWVAAGTTHRCPDLAWQKRQPRPEIKPAVSRYRR